MRLPSTHPAFAAVGGAGVQRCAGELIRSRTLTGICNDIRNPLMGATGMPFARNVEFEATFPELGATALARNRHGGRLGLLKPDPQVISRRLLSRASAPDDVCHEGTRAARLLGRGPLRLQDGIHSQRPGRVLDPVHDPRLVLSPRRGAQRSDDHGHRVPERAGRRRRAPLTAAAAARLGCRAGDRIDVATVAESADPPRFDDGGRARLARAFRTTRNTVTAWWDASQLYGHDPTSRRRVPRDPADPAKLRLLVPDPRAAAGDTLGYLPVLGPGDPINPQWAGQEAVAFPDNWSVGLSFFHTVFAREHNLFVDAFRRLAAATPDGDSGSGTPTGPARWCATGMWTPTRSSRSRASSSRRRSRRRTRSSGRRSSSTTSP
jgi:hypothetical protein